MRFIKIVPRPNLLNVAVVCFCVTAGLLGLLRVAHRPPAELDVRLYYEYSRVSFGHVGNPDLIRMIHGSLESALMDDSQTFQTAQIPYRDFTCEYPPLAFAVFLAPRLLASNYQQYVVAFRTEMSICLVLLCGVLYKILIGCGRTVQQSAWIAAATFPVAVFLLGSMITDRFDVFVSLLVGSSLMFAIRKQYVAASVFVGLGVATKLWPVLLLPVALHGLISQRRVGRVVTAILAAIVIVGTAHLPWLIISPSHAAGYLGFLGSRGLQAESVPANVVILLAKMLHRHVATAPEWGALDVLSPTLVGWAAKISTFLALASYGIILALIYSDRFRGVENPQRLVLAYIAVVLWLLLTAKVFSPQYLVWLCPAIFAVDLKASWKLLALFCAACLLTKLELYFYIQLSDLQMGPIIILTLRNAVVLLMGLVTLRALGLSLDGRFGSAQTRSPQVDHVVN